MAVLEFHIFKREGWVSGMAKSYTVPTDGIDNTPVIRVAGQYHLMCDFVEENPTKKDSGEQIDKLRVDCTCVGGLPATQKGHKLTLWLRNPSESHKDGGAFCAKIQLRLADALGLMPKNYKPGDEIEIDWLNVKGRQFVAFLTMQKGTDGVERLDLDGANIYHVDDDAVSHIPKGMTEISLLPAALRRISKDPANARNQQPAGGAAKAAATGAANGGTAANKQTAKQSQPQQSQQPVGAGAGAANGSAATSQVSMDDL